MKIAIIILAAGGSTRLGFPKQLVEIEGKALIERSIEAALGASTDVFVVLGANRAQIEPKTSTYPVSIIENANWELGMGHSIQVGVKTVLEKADFDALILTVCDQVHLTSSLFMHLIAAKKEQKTGIIAARYQGSLGVPVLFSKKYFPSLLQFSGEKGAKKLLSKHLDDCFGVDFSGGEVDVDTVEDLKNQNQK